MNDRYSLKPKSLHDGTHTLAPEQVYPVLQVVVPLQNNKHRFVPVPSSPHQPKLAHCVEPLQASVVQ
jgi:hypothetical protein